jgi:predicted RND superfamily exporter protein
MALTVREQEVAMQIRVAQEAVAVIAMQLARSVQQDKVILVVLAVAVVVVVLARWVALLVAILLVVTVVLVIILIQVGHLQQQQA